MVDGISREVALDSVSTIIYFSIRYDFILVKGVYCYYWCLQWGLHFRYFTQIMFWCTEIQFISCSLKKFSWLLIWELWLCDEVSKRLQKKNHDLKFSIWNSFKNWCFSIFILFLVNYKMALNRFWTFRILKFWIDEKLKLKLKIPECGLGVILSPFADSCFLNGLFVNQRRDLENMRSGLRPLVTDVSEGWVV